MMTNLNNILNTKINIFGSGSNSGRVWYEQSLSYFLTKLTNKYKDKINQLRYLNKRDEIAAKKWKEEDFIACTISATFNTYRQLHHIKERTGLIAIDIDKDKNKELDVEKAKIDTIKLPYVALSMLSCRGEGIWCLVPYNKKNDFRETWFALREDFESIGYTIDACKDETRLRFISYDDNMLVRKNDIEIYDKVKHIETKEVDRDYKAEDWVLTKDDLKDIVVAIYLLTQYCGYTSDEYNEWLLDGFRLATIPNKELGLKLFTMISEASDNFESFDDVEDKFEECRRTTTYKTNILGYYINKIKEYYGLEWRSKANELLGSKVLF